MRKDTNKTWNCQVETQERKVVLDSQDNASPSPPKGFRLALPVGNVSSGWDQTVRREGYSDSFEDRHETVEEILGRLRFGKEKDQVTACGKSVTKVECSNGHTFAKVLYCGKEFCSTCGQTGSYIHKRKVERIWERIGWATTIGYVVLTVPMEHRAIFYRQEKLAELHRAGWETVEEIFAPVNDVEGAVTVIHFFGDESDTWHPHVNVLFPVLGGFVDEVVLEELRREWRERLSEIVGEEVKTVVVHYTYHTEKAEQLHKVKYVSRPTIGPKRFRRLSDGERRRILGIQRFTNVRYWGALHSHRGHRWQDYRDEMIAYGGAWTEPVEEKHHRGCPECGEALRFVCVLPREDLDQDNWRKVSENWYQLVESYDSS